jgi:hypothetical protein
MMRIASAKVKTYDSPPMSTLSELQKIATDERNGGQYCKEKFIVFRTLGKKINLLDCQLLFNENENWLA